MPNYGYVCEGCKYTFERFLKMSERDDPLSEDCPKCKNKKISKDFNTMLPSLSSDATLSPDKATGGRWSELMNKMKGGLSKRFHKKLDKTKGHTGRQWKG
jgi:putative FmdB family regulatory protein